MVEKNFREDRAVDFATVTLRWSTPIPMDGADASPIPSRGGVYEILYQDVGGIERMFVGESEDLRGAFVSHAAGDKGNDDLRRGILSHVTFYRYWECEVRRRRLEVVAALVDGHVYDCGHDEIEDVACIRLVEIY